MDYKTKENNKKKLFSICIPVYNNEGNIPITIPYIIEHLSLFPEYEVEIVMVNDGSSDNSYNIMKEYKNLYPDIIRIASLTRNFGQGACCHACYEMAKGDVIGVISADGQDPFELFVDMLSEWEKGNKIVIANRANRDEKGLSVLFSKMFHKLIHKFINQRYPEGGFDFLIMDREVLDKYLQIDQVDSMGQLKLLWLGYKFQTLYYTRTVRNSGKSGYKIVKRINLAWETLIYESALPIHCLCILGIFLCVAAITLLIGEWFLSISNICKGSNLFYISCLVMVGSGLNLTGIGVIGEYLWNQFKFIKELPRYVIDEETGDE